MLRQTLCTAMLMSVVHSVWRSQSKKEAFAHDAYLKSFVATLGIWHAKFFACGFAGCTEKKPVKIGGSFSLKCTGPVA
tara:strand:+ start:36 stop:269 length:234 start_codon:yes stop_codon:yes gene_type:complete